MSYLVSLEHLVSHLKKLNNFPCLELLQMLKNNGHPFGEQ